MFKKGQFMGTYLMILLVGIIIGIGVAWYLSSSGLLTSLFCPTTAVP